MRLTVELMTLHPQKIQKNGETAFVILPFEEFLEIQERLEDLDDLTTLRSEKAKSANDPGHSLDRVLADLIN